MKFENKLMQARSSARSFRTPSHAAISSRAMAIWRERGCIEGRDTEIWLEAELQLWNDSQKRSTVLAHPRTMFDENHQPTHEIEKLLAEIAQPASDRSPTSL